MKTKEEKRNEAIARNEVYSKLTPQQKLEQLDKHNLVASKQRNKLMRLINKAS